MYSNKTHMDILMKYKVVTMYIAIKRTSVMHIGNELDTVPGSALFVNHVQDLGKGRIQLPRACINNWCTFSREWDDSQPPMLNKRAYCVFGQSRRGKGLATHSCRLYFP